MQLHIGIVITLTRQVISFAYHIYVKRCHGDIN